MRWVPRDGWSVCTGIPGPPGPRPSCRVRGHSVPDRPPGGWGRDPLDLGGQGRLPGGGAPVGGGLVLRWVVIPEGAPADPGRTLLRGEPRVGAIKPDGRSLTQMLTTPEKGQTGVSVAGWGAGASGGPGSGWVEHLGGSQAQMRGPVSPLGPGWQESEQGSGCERGRPRAEFPDTSCCPPAPQLVLKAGKPPRPTSFPPPGPPPVSPALPTWARPGRLSVRTCPCVSLRGSRGRQVHV